MKIYTLVGKSGTGKSHHATELCKNKNIESIIDDGLFIYRNNVIAGTSAKRQDTKIGAVKTALFHKEEYRTQVIEAIKKKKPKSILIIGTSMGMVNKIIVALELIPADAPDDDERWQAVERVFIEDISTEEERNIARVQRDKLGKHVIPAPSLQLKTNFAGYFLDPLRLLRGKDPGAAGERTVVRPTFSYMGEYIVDERVLGDIVECAARENQAIAGVIRVSQDPRPDAYKLTVSIKMKKGCPVWDTAAEFQKRIVEVVERMTAFNVTEVNVEVRAVE